MEIKSMDINILLSIINMKLRDNYISLEELCYDMEVSQKELVDRLKKEGYTYNEQLNQFKIK